MILPEDQITDYNRQKVKWFIGDINHSKAKELGLNPRWEGEPGKVVMLDNGPVWEAWGSCNGHAYQLFGWYNTDTRELTNIRPLPRVSGQDYYFHQETYDLLTKK